MGVGIVRKLTILVKADNKADDDNQDAGEVRKPYGIVGDLAEEDDERIGGAGKKVDNLPLQFGIWGMSCHVVLVLGKRKRDDS